MSAVLAGIRSYPYVNARVRAMRAHLVTDQDYRKLAKMDLSEIAEYLGSNGYKAEIEEFGANYEGEELLERAVKRNLANTYQKLMRISPETVQDLLRTYFRKFDVSNLKTLLRHVSRGETGELVDVWMPTRDLDLETLQQLAQHDSLDAVLEAVESHGFRGIRDQIDDSSNLQQVEDALDQYYYEQLLAEAEHVEGSARFQRFLQLEAALKNITLILRMKRGGYSYDEIMDRLIPIPRNRQIIDNAALANLGTGEEVMDRIQESKVGAYIGNGSAVDVSRALEQYKLEKGIEMLHTYQLSVNPVLGFMICKEIEARNLRIIIRAKEETLGEEFIDRHLITGVAS